MILNSVYAPYYYKPRQDLNKKGIVEKYGSVEDWYGLNLRYIASLWNNAPPHKQFVTNPQITEIDEIIQNFKYYLGQQDNKGLNFDLQFVDTMPWMKGQSIVTFIDHITGQIRNLVASSRFTVKSHNKETVSKRDEKVDMAIMRLRLGELFSEVRDVLGINFDPLGPESSGMAMDTPEDVMDWVSTQWRDAVELIALKIVRQIQADNKYQQQYGKAVKDVAIGRFTGMHVYDYKGMVLRDVIEPQYLIFDHTTTDELGYYDQEIGFIQFLRPEEIFAKWDLNAEERDQIYRMSQSKANNPLLELWNVNGSNNFIWWNGYTGKIACVTGYWKSYYDPSGKTDVKERIQFIHGGTLIGNKFLKTFGSEKYIVRNIFDKGECSLPIMRFVPSIHIGQNRSMVDRLRPLQDTLDELEKKIKEKYARDLGKVYIIKGGHYQVNIKELAEDLRILGVHVVSPTGEVDDPMNNDRMVEVLDFTIDPNIYRYFEAKKQYKQEMQEIVNISTIALGQQMNYIGAATQQQALQQSNIGQASFIQSFFEYVIQVEQFCLEKAKLMATFNPDSKKYLEKFLSERELAYLDQLDDFTFNDLRVYTKVEDIIDDSARQRMLAYAQAWSQDPSFPKEAILSFETARTFTELQREIKKVIEKSKLDAQKQAMIQQMVEQANIQQSRQDQMEMQNNQIQGELSNTMLKEQGKLADTYLQGQQQAQNSQDGI